MRQVLSQPLVCNWTEGAPQQQRWDCPPRTRLVVLALGDPHLLEGGEGGKDGPADPDGVLALRRGNHLRGVEPRRRKESGRGVRGRWAREGLLLLWVRCMVGV